MAALAALMLVSLMLVLLVVCELRDVRFGHTLGGDLSGQEAGKAFSAPSQGTFRCGVVALLLPLGLCRCIGDLCSLVQLAYA